MKTLKKLLFAALATIGFSFAAQAAVNLEEIKTRLVPEDATDVVLDTKKGEISYPYNGDQIIIYAEPESDHEFVVPGGVSKIEYLVVGGGGGGGGSASATKSGGGGGGGGVVTNTTPCAINPGTTLTITVGAGGTAGSGKTTASLGKGLGGDGGTSKILDGEDEIVKALGGGGGAGGSIPASNTGANGGGGSATYITGGIGKGAAGDGVGGHNGGNGYKNSNFGGGGAGAKEGGGTRDTTLKTSGKGGDGVDSWITGAPITYAGGGGGGKSELSGYTAGVGGAGGGGNGGNSSSTTGGPGNAGKDGLGGGGGGHGPLTSSTSVGGKGGSGIVVIRYTPPPSAFPVTFSDPENATVSAKVDGFTINSGGLVLNGEDVVVEVTPDEFYEYAEAPEGWEKVEDSTAITRTFKVDYKDLEIEAPAPTEKPTFTVTALSCENGSIEGAGTYHRDEVATLTAIPDDGYAFKAWTGAAEGQEGAAIQLTITANIEVGATFEKMAADKRLVYYTGGKNTSYTVKSGDEDVPSGSPVDVGATVVVVVKPNEHYAFIEIPEGWVAGQEPGSLTKSFKADEDVTFEIPSAELITFELEVTQPEHGLIRGAESGILTEGALVELSVEAYEGYEFVNWTTNDAPAGTEATLSFTMQEDMSVGAEITRICRAVTFEAPENTEMTVRVGDEDIESGDPVEYGSEVVVTILPVGEFEYPTIPTDWKKGDVEGSITRTYTAGDQPLELNDLPPTTAIPRYKLTVEACENGIIEVEGGLADDYLRDTEVTLTAKPNTGYILSYWTGSASGAVNPITVKMTKDMTVGAVFRQTADFDAYERGNLIAMWDSKDGGHINSTGWSDTSGRYTFKWSDATKVNYATAKKDGISFNGAWATLTSADSDNTFGKAASGTIEIVLKDVPNQNQFLFEDKTKMAGIYWVKSPTDYGLFGQMATTTTCSKYAVEEEGVHTFTFKYAKAAWSKPAIVDGEDIPTGSYNTSFSTATSFPSGVGTYFGRRSYNSYANSYLQGKILSIRLYSTKLTTEQIKANGVIDKDRFIKKPGLAIMFF